MNKLNKEEALMAVAETIEEIGEPLQRFFSDTRDLNKFIDVVRGRKMYLMFYWIKISMAYLMTLEMF